MFLFMANEEHLALRKQRTAIWHDWRMKNPASLSDLHEADLSEAKFGATDLRGRTSQGRRSVRRFESMSYLMKSADR
jgi:hypothetical protein